MSELRVIKTEEQAPAATPEKVSPPHNIKERLNLHVKRRLETSSGGAINSEEVKVQFVANKRSYKQKEAPKTRRPYQKRADKTNAQTTSAAAATAAESGRKNKRQKKSTAAAELHNNNNNKASGAGALSDEPATVTFAGGNGEDDGSHDGSHETEIKGAGRDKDKCPDVLGLVLSMKKRALMQDPAVQRFLCRVMNEIKS